MRRVGLIASLIAFVASPALAHPEGFSGLRLLVRDDSARAVLTLHTRDLSRWFPPAKFPNYVPDVCAAMQKNPGELLEVRADGKTLDPTTAHAKTIDVGLIEINLDYATGGACREIEVFSKHLVQLPQGHQQLFFAIDARGKAADADYGPTLREETLSVENDSVTVEIPARSATAPTTAGMADAKTQATGTPAPPVKRISFFALGVEHIVTGYDHLLFLAALLLVCRNFREAASVITFFTIAHTITLTLAALGYVRLPGRIVEPAIAASIVYVGLENIFGRHRFIWRALVTFGFGLVHGLGFASALREVGLGSKGVGLAMPLLKFSVGLETGQLCIAAIVLSVMLALRRREWFERRWVPAGSMLVSIIGAYWLVTRVIAG